MSESSYGRPSGEKLTVPRRLCYRHKVLTQNVLSQSNYRYQSYWWWSVGAEGANC